MAVRTEPQPHQDLTDLAAPVVALAEAGRSREADVVIAYLALWVLDRVEAGRMTGDEADAIFTALDVGLTDAGALDRLSDEAGDLIMEGHHFHHWGDEWGTDPPTVRRLAGTILAPAG